jgi:hypothetical protein
MSISSEETVLGFFCVSGRLYKTFKGDESMTTATKEKSGIKIMVKDVSRFRDKISRMTSSQ